MPKRIGHCAQLKVRLPAGVLQRHGAGVLAVAGQKERCNYNIAVMECEYSVLDGLPIVLPPQKATRARPSCSLPPPPTRRKAQGSVQFDARKRNRKTVLNTTSPVAYHSHSHTPNNLQAPPDRVLPVFIASQMISNHFSVQDTPMGQLPPAVPAPCLASGPRESD